MFRWIEHTAELELEITAASKEAVFAEALAAFAELVNGDASGEPVERTVTVSAPDDPSLLAEWVGEFVFLAETEDFVPERPTRLEVGRNEVSATVAGHLDEPSHLVKSVTYHRLRLQHSDGAWTAGMVFDV
jgi:SHS2 domain-containing protein